MAMRVVIVDDENDILSILKDALSSAGLDVAAFERAEPALAFVAEHDAEVLVADLRLPGTNGLALVGDVRVASPDTQVIILTGFGDMRSAVEALRLGAYDYLTKPVDVDRLVQSIRNAAERRALIRANRTLLRSLEEANRLKAEFIRGMNHEVRTPLGHVLGFAQILEDTLEGLSEKQRRYFDNIRSGAQQLLEMFENILQFSALQAGEARLHLSEFSVRGLVDDCLGGHREAAARKSIRLEVDLGAQDVQAGADIEMCRKILSVLLDNAVKFTPDGGVVTIRADARPEPDCPEERLPAGNRAEAWLHLSVSDTGPGIDPGDQERIFNLFEQLDADLARQHQGAGLGLALGMSLARGQGGTITVESQPGTGSCFTAIIPMVAD
jgi:signal transduction histidine kinase